MIHRFFNLIGRVSLIALALALASCHRGAVVGGYRAGGVYDESIRSVAVPIFENRTFYRGVEFRLTEALTKEIEQRTPYKVAGTAGADSQLTGTILRVDKKLLSRQHSREIKSGLPQEVQVVVSVSFEWKNLRTGKIIRKASRIEGTGEYIPTRGVGEPFEVAQHTAVAELAREVVSAMRADW